MDFDEAYPIDQEIVEAFCQAASHGNMDTVITYLNAYGDKLINEQDAIKGRAITWAAFAGHVDIVELLLERGAAIDAGGTGGKPALSWAIDSGRLDAIEFLLQQGASMLQPDHKGQTPIDHARLSSNPKIMPILQRYLDVERDHHHRVTEAAIKDMVETRRERMKKFKAPKFKQP